MTRNIKIAVVLGAIAFFMGTYTATYFAGHRAGYNSAKAEQERERKAQQKAASKEVIDVNTVNQKSRNHGLSERGKMMQSINRFATLALPLSLLLLTSACGGAFGSGRYLIDSCTTLCEPAPDLLPDYAADLNGLAEAEDNCRAMHNECVMWLPKNPN